jgi:ElaB/YqjD/DUF883 family membrane-anchored ribosome-binding protein
MDLPVSPKEVVEQVVSKVEEVLPELVNKVQEVMPELTDNVEDAVKKVDDLANDALNKFVERVPQAARAVEVVNEALAGVACSCGLFGWTLSASRSPRSPAKPAVLSSEASK